MATTHQPDYGTNRRMVEKMIRVAAIKKTGGIEGLVRNYTPGRVEVEGTITGTDFGPLYEKYVACLQRKEIDDEFLSTFSTVSEVLTPAEINAFLHGTIQYEDHHNYLFHTGYIISRLLQNSYTAGYNNFRLDMIHPFCSIASEIQGTPEKPLTLTLFGDVGDDCGGSSKNIAVTVHGSVGEECFNGSEDSSFMLYGTVGILFAHGAKNCTFTLYFQKRKRIGSGFGNDSENCTFKTTDFDKAKWMYGNVLDENKVYFIDGDKEKLIDRIQI